MSHQNIDNFSDENPLLQPFNTPYQAIPFDKIRLEHYLPAFNAAIQLHNDEINGIIAERAAPNFHNTVEALEESGRLLSILTQLFFNLNSAETNDAMQTLAEEVSALLTGHANDISLNTALFQRIKIAYTDQESLNLSAEQSTLLQKTYDGFVDNGANLNDADKKIYRELTLKLEAASLTFDKHLLKEINDYRLIIYDKDLLKGLSDDFLDAAEAKAKQKNESGWLLDLTAPSYVPAMKFLADRQIRETLYMAYSTRCAHDDENNNQQLISDIVNLRLRLANLLGYKTYADYVLKDRMAENSSNVYKLLDDLLHAYKPQATKEVEQVSHYAHIHGLEEDLQPWDWAYYAEHLKNEKFAFNEEILRPYFELSNVISGVFGLATRLYGITFQAIDDVPTYHPEVQVFQVNDQNGHYLALLYADFFPRPGKRTGAWMTEYKAQWKENNSDNRPHISLVMNFTRPTSSKPALLSFDEVNTFLHEFGHALHGILSDVNYASLSGTNVPRDFVECPSQFMENYLVEKEFLDDFAVHFETGAKISPELISKVKSSRNYNAGYACLRQLHFGLIDMQWHILQQPFDGNVRQFEQQLAAKVTVLPIPRNTCISSAFSHIFSGGYAAGYYSYKWAEVIAADAYAAFKEHGIFNISTATSLRNNILAKGGTEKPTLLYQRFRGKEPSINALLESNEIATL